MFRIIDFTNSNARTTRTTVELDFIFPWKFCSETANRSSRVQMTNQRRIYGSMSGRQRGAIRETTNESVGSLDSDSDLLIDGDLDDEDEDEDDDEDDDPMNPAIAHDIVAFDIKNNPEKRSVSKIEHSDEDF